MNINVVYQQQLTDMWTQLNQELQYVGRKLSLYGQDAASKFSCNRKQLDDKQVDATKSIRDFVVNIDCRLKGQQYFVTAEVNSAVLHVSLYRLNYAYVLGLNLYNVDNNS